MKGLLLVHRANCKAESTLRKVTLTRQSHAFISIRAVLEQLDTITLLVLLALQVWLFICFALLSSTMKIFLFLFFFLSFFPF